MEIKKLRDKNDIVSEVYKIAFKDGTFYIAQSKNIGKRMSQHIGKKGMFKPDDIEGLEYKKVDEGKRDRGMQEQEWIDDSGDLCNENIRNKINPVSD